MVFQILLDARGPQTQLEGVEGEAQGAPGQFTTPQVPRAVGQCSYSVKDGPASLLNMSQLGEKDWQKAKRGWG